MIAAVIVIAIVIASACGGAPAREARTPVRASWEGPLTALAPDAARLVVVARPRELWDAPATRRVIESLAPDDRLETYRQHTGIDPRDLDELVWAELEGGSVLAVRGPFRAPLAVAEMGRRMLPMESSADAPFVRRGGHYHGARRDLIALSDHTLLVVTGAPALTEAILRRAREAGRSPEAPGAARDPRGGELRPVAVLQGAHADAPVIAIAPEPLRLPPGSGVALLLAREEALAIAAWPADDGAIRLALDLRGEFPPAADENFRALAASLAQSDLGASLGMRDALPTLSVESGDRAVVLRASVPAPALAAGLRVLFDAEIAELVGPPPALAEGGGAPGSEAGNEAGTVARERR